MARQFLTPSRIVTGEGALEDSVELLGSLGTRAFVVTGPVMVKLGNCKKVTDVLEQAGLGFEVFDQITDEPSDTMIEAGVAAFKASDCDMFVGLGGGSPIDAVKAIAMMAACDGDIDEQMGKKLDFDRPPLVAIPTTAGTGSEVTQFTIINNTRAGIKMLLAGAKVLPDVAIVDPQFTATAPAGVTANTGVDALCHALESATSRKAQPMSYTFSISAIKRILTNLLTCYTEPDNMEARTQMAIAATEAGIAFNNASVTIIHGMSRPIGALFHVPHGLSNAMIMLECLRYVVDGAYPEFAALAREVGASASTDDKAAATELLDVIEGLLRDLNIPTLRAYGIDADEFRTQIPKMAHDAIESGSPANTIKPLDAADLETIYERLISA